MSTATTAEMRIIPLPLGLVPTQFMPACGDCTVKTLIPLCPLKIQPSPNQACQRGL